MSLGSCVSVENPYWKSQRPASLERDTSLTAFSHLISFPPLVVQCYRSVACVPRPQRPRRASQLTAGLA